MAIKMIEGNKPLRFGYYELRKTLDWKTVVLGLATISLSLLVPVLESMDTGTGTMIAMSALVAVIARAVIEWMEDNSRMKLPPET